MDNTQLVQPTEEKTLQSQLSVDEQIKLKILGLTFNQQDLFYRISQQPGREMFVENPQDGNPIAMLFKEGLVEKGAIVGPKSREKILWRCVALSLDNRNLLKGLVGIPS